jgi:RNA polymerase sigma-70 factor (ECF subfamily)
MMPVMTAPEISEDDGLVRAAAAGDRAAFGELYVRYARLVHGILLARVPPEEADDLVQDVFLSAMRQLRGLRTVAAFRGWLAAIARNRATDYFRQTRPCVAIEENMRPESPAKVGGLDALEVLDLIRQLPEAYRETMILRLVEGMTGPEIALETGLTADSVRVNLCRGMKMLRGLLGGVDAK